jgi:hypothetical protein
MSWFTQPRVREALLTIGSDMTDARKSAIMSDFVHFRDLEFLKRRFARIEGMWRCPIAEKTLWKMLSVRITSTLSHVDHHAQLVSNVLAEAYLHGREKFSFFRELVLTLCAKYQIISPKLVIQEYEWYENRFKEGNYVTWDPLGMVETEI